MNKPQIYLSMVVIPSRFEFEIFRIQTQTNNFIASYGNKNNCFVRRKRTAHSYFFIRIRFHVDVYSYCDFPLYNNEGCRSNMKTEAGRLPRTFFLTCQKKRRQNPEQCSYLCVTKQTNSKTETSVNFCHSKWCNNL